MSAYPAIDQYNGTNGCPPSFAPLLKRRPLIAARASRRRSDSVEQQDEEEEKLPPAAELPAETRDAIAKAVAALAIDTFVEADVRYKALTIARLLGGEGYGKLLSDLADQAELENTPLLNAVKAEQRRLQEAKNHS